MGNSQCQKQAGGTRKRKGGCGGCASPTQSGGYMYSRKASLAAKRRLSQRVSKSKTYRKTKGQKRRQKRTKRRKRRKRRKRGKK